MENASAISEYVQGALFGARTADTFELQMLRDQTRRLELAARMKGLREESPYTQEAVADAIGLKLRSYQKAEKTGGISYEKLRALAELHDVDFDWLLKGEAKATGTPDLFADSSKSIDDPPDVEMLTELVLEIRGELRDLAAEVRRLVAQGPGEHSESQ